MPYRDKEKARIYARERARRIRALFPDREKKAQSTQYRKTKKLAFQKLGNKCSNTNCKWLNADGTIGCIDSRCLQIDHVKNDGYNNRVIGTQLHNDILRDSTNKYQLLCANCNWIKRAIYDLARGKQHQ